MMGLSSMPVRMAARVARGRQAMARRRSSVARRLLRIGFSARIGAANVLTAVDTDKRTPGCERNLADEARRAHRLLGARHGSRRPAGRRPRGRTPRLRL